LWHKIRGTALAVGTLASTAPITGTIGAGAIAVATKFPKITKLAKLGLIAYGKSKLDYGVDVLFANAIEDEIQNTRLSAELQVTDKG
jgi:hypothetical protein